MKMSGVIRALILFVLISLLVPRATTYADAEERPMKVGILLAAFGSTIPEAQVSFANVESSVKRAFPELEIVWAYTSRTIIAKMAREGKHLATPAEALAKMTKEEFTHVVVQSLHTIPGAEFHGLVKNVHRFAGMSNGIREVSVGYPMLATSKDVQRVAEIMLEIVPPERKKEDAVVFMGHGTHHPANVYYAALNYHLQKLDSNMVVGTVEGWPEIGDIKKDLKNKHISKVYLMPFMSVAGDHVRHDMAGTEKGSWKSILEDEGIECVAVLKGTAEYQKFVDIWVDHLKTAFGNLR
jgi:sirohydrochlorin cobaltochelatase